MPECRDCGAEIRWAKTPKGKNIMLELDPETWALGKKLWRIEPGVEGLDAEPLSQLDIEQAGGDIEGYAVHWDVCGMTDEERSPKDQMHADKARARAQEDAALPAQDLEPDKHGNRYGSLYGRKPDQPIQEDLFNLSKPVPSERKSLHTRLRGLVTNWRQMADTYDEQAAEHHGSLSHEKKAAALNLRACATELEGHL